VYRSGLDSAGLLQNLVGGGGLVYTQWRTSEFYKMCGSFCPAERLSGSQK